CCHPAEIIACPVATLKARLVTTFIASPFEGCLPRLSTKSEEAIRVACTGRAVRCRLVQSRRPIALAVGGIACAIVVLPLAGRPAGGARSSHSRYREMATSHGCQLSLEARRIVDSSA